MIKKLLGLVFNRWVLLAALLLAVALVIWSIGPIVAIGESRPLESERSRWITILAMLGLTALVVAWQAWRARRGNNAVVQQLMTAPAAGDKKEAESPDMAAVRERFEKSLSTLKRARFGSGGGLLAGWSAQLGGRYLYELPWYLIIGAPGSGKTTALHNCGLKFPLAETLGDHAVRGVGGTRNCDWWFTDRAVLLDTAGRFTTQDSDRENDKATWSGFLGLLKKSRPRQPVNGVLVTVSIADLLTRGTTERAQHAATVRQRLQELHEQLNIRFPIYLLVTKCDLLAGFMDYFATLDKDLRAAPWGFTFALAETQGKRPQAEPQGPARFSAEFDALRQRLGEGLIDRLQAERDPQRRARIYGFPGQFTGLRGVLQEFVETVFSPSPYEAEPLLRGVYFISGTQEGTPIDRVLGAVARSYRLERAIIAPNQSSGKSYFLTRLLGEVVFAESGLAGTNLKWERRRRLLALGGYAAVALLALGALLAWSVSYVNNRRYVDAVARSAGEVRQLVQATPNRSSADILPIIPALDATRSLANAGAVRDQGTVPWSLGFGLYQGDKLDSGARAAYGHMLEDAVLPRIALRVEDRLRQGGEAPETQYEALKAYLMLHDPQHFDADALKAYVEREWETQYGRELSAEQRAQLSAHLDALLERGAVTSPLAADPGLIDASRNQLARIPLPQRIYNRMRQQGLSRDFPEFTVIGAAGNDAAIVFERASGAPLTKGVPGLYSYKGYHEGFQKEVSKVSKQLDEEQGWVLGVAGAPQGVVAGLRSGQSLVDDVRRLYLNDYASTWENFVADLRLQPMSSSLSQSVQMARLLSASNSPLPPLLKAISRETTLLAGDKGLLGKAGEAATGIFKKSSKALTDKLGTASGADSGPPLESIVDDRFAGLRQMVTAPEGGKAPLDDTIALIGEVYVLLNAVDTAVKSKAAPPASPVPNKVKAEAARLPEPLRPMLETLAQSSGQVAQTVVRQNLSGEVRSQVGEFCAKAIAGRYPITRGSSTDITQADFAQLFAPGGKMDQFFQQQLAPHVDTSTRPWSFRQEEGGALGKDRGSLPQFQRAQAIRETFFAAGNTPSLRLTFKPIEMDASIQHFILDVDGQKVLYEQGPPIPTTVQWPGPRGSSQVRVDISPTRPGATSGMVNDGPWALFHLLDRVKLEPAGAPERFRATFNIDGRKAVFEVTASSVRNPFLMPELREFSCPMGL